MNPIVLHQQNPTLQTLDIAKAARDNILARCISFFNNIEPLSFKCIKATMLLDLLQGGCEPPPPGSLRALTFHVIQQHHSVRDPLFLTKGHHWALSNHEG
jgi:hypothetical protein